MSYAENTSVPADRSRAEIERTLQRYGPSKFMYGYDEEHSMIAFVANGRWPHGEVVPPLGSRGTKRAQRWWDDTLGELRDRYEEVREL